MNAPYKLDDDNLISLITSDDTTDRFNGEYYELCIRIYKLAAYIHKYRMMEFDENEKHKYTKDVYRGLVLQLGAMYDYRISLVERAEREDIKLYYGRLA